MVLEHLPWGVVLDENVTLEGLKSFPVVLLPGVAILSDRELAILRRYVEDGGSLIVSRAGPAFWTNAARRSSTR